LRDERLEQLHLQSSGKFYACSFDAVGLALSFADDRRRLPSQRKLQQKPRGVGARPRFRSRGTGREYLHEPLSIDELHRIVQLLGVRPIDIVRRSEPQSIALALNDATPDEEVLRAMAEHPILIERPILVRNGRAVVGRPPETVKEIL
jgi:arsenate reductase